MNLLRSILLAGMAAVAFGMAEASAEGSYDPWENFNRKVFAFNDALDVYFLKPLAKGYTAITPDPLENGISNVFDNLLEVRNIINDLLQAKLAQAGNDTGRLLINSSIGLVGLIDVAKHLGLAENSGEDFGQTLAMWGSGQGAYLVLPLFGPSTVRDAFAFPVDSFANPVNYVEHVPTRNSISGVDLLDTRAQLLDVEAFANGDKYVFLREAFLQRRNYLINDGEIKDDFESEGEF